MINRSKTIKPTIDILVETLARRGIHLNLDYVALECKGLDTHSCKVTVTGKNGRYGSRSYTLLRRNIAEVLSSIPLRITPVTGIRQPIQRSVQLLGYLRNNFGIHLTDTDIVDEPMTPVAGNWYTIRIHPDNPVWCGEFKVHYTCAESDITLNLPDVSTPIELNIPETQYLQASGLYADVDTHTYREALLGTMTDYNAFSVMLQNLTGDNWVTLNHPSNYNLYGSTTTYDATTKILAIRLHAMYCLNVRGTLLLNLGDK